MVEDQLTVGTLHGQDIENRKTEPTGPALRSATETLVTALARAQGQMRNVAFDRQNPHFKSKYASLAAILDMIRQPLSDNGLALTQTLEPFPEGLRLVTTLRGYGETIESAHPLPSNVKSQEFGSALTYARRYSLTAMLNVSADDDDDANIAQSAKSNEIISPSQLIALEALIDESKANLGKFLGWAGVTELKFFPVSLYDDGVAMLKTKLSKMS
jgi:hypothetical protein